ncbi:MAG: LysR family transcriptional regulator [Pseudomonadota bacterium]
MQTRHLPNLSALRAFDAAARHESFTKAGEELGLTQAAISRHIRHLETDLGFALFTREHRAVSLTEAGADYAARVIEGFAQLADAPRQLPRPEITLDIDAELLRFWLLPRMSQTLIDGLNVRLNLRARADRPRLLPGDTDIAIIWGALDYAGFKRQPFLQPTIIAVASSSCPAQSVSELDGTILLHDQTDQWWRRMFAAAKLPYPEAQMALGFSRCDFPVDAAVQGLGAAVSDDVIAAHFLATGRLKRLEGPTLKSQDYFLLTRKNGPPKEADPFLDWLTAQA